MQRSWALDAATLDSRKEETEQCQLGVGVGPAWPEVMTEQQQAQRHWPARIPLVLQNEGLHPL